MPVRDEAGAPDVVRGGTLGRAGPPLRWLAAHEPDLRAAPAAPGYAPTAGAGRKRCRCPT
jgi:hypothetical protein